MARDLTHTDAAELLGAYALDALDAAERVAVDHHLADCALCSTEVMEQIEVAGLLSSGVTSAPAAVWERIRAEIDADVAPPPLDMAPIHRLRERVPEATRPPEQSDAGYRPADRSPRDGSSRDWSSPGRSHRSRRGNRLRVGALVAAASVVTAMVGVLGLKVVEDGNRIDTLTAGAHEERLERTIDAALANPEAVRVEMSSPDSELFAEAILLPDGRGYIVRDNLPRLDPDMAYQLWAVVGPNRISIGVLGRGPSQTAFVASGPVAALAITAEQAGGVVATLEQPVVVGDVQQI